MITPKIIFEDKSILVLDKPAGFIVNRAETAKNITLQDWIEENFQFPIFNFRFCRSGVVHRLDKDTSGLIVIAKTKPTFENLQRQFKERTVQKKYLALVHGRVEPQEGIIKASISRNPFNRKKFGVFLGGREAETEYKLVRYYLSDKLEEFSLLELTPKTGRTHQIRVHLKYINHPIVGDEFYAGRKTVRRDQRWCPRQFLHANFLSFKHPKTGEIVKFSSPVPYDLKKALDTFHSAPLG